MKTKKMFSFTIVILLIVSLLPISALAEGVSDGITLSVVYKDGDKSIADATFNVYLVATPDENGSYIPTESFASHPVDYSVTTDEELYNLATTLEGYVIFGKEDPIYTAKTDDNGMFEFATDTKGMYLLVGEKTLVDDIYYTAESFIICLPAVDESGDELYDVTVNAKFTAVHKDNPPTMRKVIKVWDDEGNDGRPSSVTVYLLKNGEIFDNATLNKDNDWTHVWYDLDGTARWSIVELPVENYKVVVTRESTAYFVKNAFKEPTPPDENLPQTGQLWWPIPVFAVIGVALIAIGVVFTKKNRCEK